MGKVKKQGDILSIASLSILTIIVFKTPMIQLHTLKTDLDTTSTGALKQDRKPVLGLQRSSSNSKTV